MAGTSPVNESDDVSLSIPFHVPYANTPVAENLHAGRADDEGRRGHGRARRAGALVVEVAATFMVVCTVPAACDGHGVGGDRAGDGRVRPRKVYTSRAL